jgi:CO dehydrogenase maturation factor
LSAVRVGVVGKTGSGKTTVSALLAMAAAAEGRRVAAVDTDVVPNLGVSLGLGQEATEQVRTVPRAMARGRAGGALTTAQLWRGYGVPTPAGPTLLHAMPISQEEAGCCCTAHASVRSLLADALAEVDLCVVDMEDGLDHLDRPSGTLAHADALLLVVEPIHKSSAVATHIAARARRHGIDRLAVVGTKAHPGPEDAAFLTAAAAELGAPLVAIVPHSDAVIDADRAGTGLVLGAGPLGHAIDALLHAVWSK